MEKKIIPSAMIYDVKSLMETTYVYQYHIYAQLGTN